MKDRSITIISLSIVSKDSRVQRHIQYFISKGYGVQVISLVDCDTNARPQGATYFDVDISQSHLWNDPVGDFSWKSGVQIPPLFKKISRFFRYISLAINNKDLEWHIAYFKRRLRETGQIEEIINSLEPTSLVLANDWNTLVHANEMQRKWKAISIYDSHEVASEEFADLLDWRILIRPGIQKIEKNLIGSFDIVTTVSNSISEHLFDTYSLSKRPSVIRNIPQTVCDRKDDNQFSNKNDTIQRFLYLGVVAKRRELEKLVSSLEYWRSDQNLTITGPRHNSEYASHLIQLAKSKNVGHKLTIDPPVAPNKVVEYASKFDIGLIVLPTKIKQNQWAMPNKLYEYLHANLMIVSAPLLDISQMIQQHKVGMVVQTKTQKLLGNSIARITDKTVAQYKTAAQSLISNISWTDDYTTLSKKIALIIGEE